MSVTVTSTMRQLAMFEGIKERIQCPKCGSKHARWRKKLANWLCLRCGTVYHQAGPVKLVRTRGAA